jgi:hypothetical protein
VGPECGQALDDPSRVDLSLRGTDALVILKSALGLLSCDLCVCDTNGSGTIEAQDALRALQASVGLPVPLTCPPCATEVASNDSDSARGLVHRRARP